MAVLTYMEPLNRDSSAWCWQVQHLNLSRYIDMLKSAEFRDDLDVVSTIHTPKGRLLGIGRALPGGKQSSLIRLSPRGKESPLV